MKHKREYYIPDGAREVRDDESDAVAYHYKGKGRSDGKPCAVYFCGRRQKPDANYRFRDTTRRDEYTKRHFEGRREHGAFKAEAKAKATKALGHAADKLKVGDVYSASWGYDQTNVDFYVITEILGRVTVMLQPLGYDIVKTNDSGAEYVVPALRNHEGMAMKKRVNAYGGFSINSYMAASPWNGKPAYQTAAGWGH